MPNFFNVQYYLEKLFFIFPFTTNPCGGNSFLNYSGTGSHLGGGMGRDKWRALMEKKFDILLPPSPLLPLPSPHFLFFKGFSCFAITEPIDGWPCWLLKLKQMENQGVRTLSSGFLRFSAKFGTCTVVSVWPLLKLKCAHSPLNLRILYSSSVPFTLSTVQVPTLALTHKKRITVYERGPSLVGSSGLSCCYNLFLSCFGLL